MSSPVLIERRRTVFFAPGARKHFMTKRAAAQAEAKAMLSKKYPHERPEYDVGFDGWHWRQDERLCRVYERLWRRILRAGVEVGEISHG